MKRSLYIPLVLGLVAIGLSSIAVAAPRGAGSKIRGDYAFDAPSRASQRTFYRAPAPTYVERSEPAVAQTEGNRRFSAEPEAPAVDQPQDQEPVRTQAPTTRRYSYEPEAQTWTGETYRRPSASMRSRAFPSIRRADSKIRGDY